MKKMSCQALMVLATVGLGMMMTGCISYGNRAPSAGVPLEDLKTTATYDVIGDATGTSTGAVLFGIIPIGGENKSGQLGSMILVNPVEKAAVYNAIESVPTADALLAPRFNTKVSNYIVYKEQTVTVKGKAIRYNPSVK